jgi:general secretion pathway protein H
MSNGSEGGFTLLEMVCVLAPIAMMAAVLLPFIPHSTSRARLQANALQAATLLKADRNAAIRRGWTSTRWWTTSRPVIGRGNLRAVHSHDI